jgi:hypothetical protein
MPLHDPRIPRTRAERVCRQEDEFSNRYDAGYGMTSVPEGEFSYRFHAGFSMPNIPD